ncbi:hypothetical protein VHEMI03162 [[Torrubiella] hemipterigena]|uniref:GH18 domain-containing protein n=1 Tax=[Torrubiella] hemipterigena TaxID=1531966 RepID=A0A0A1TCR4_9HYPO|nr:hypothetical protein VHEMI03162 [[Torrubiella] hemipterigena]
MLSRKFSNTRRAPYNLMAGYYRIWTDTAGNPGGSQRMDDLPDCLDIAFVFPEGGERNEFYTMLNSTYAPTLQKRGTKVVKTVGIASLTNTNYPNTAAGYASLAKYLVKYQVTDYGLDGLDVDVEELSGTRLQKATGVFQELSKLLGPKSGTGKLLIFDTNQSGANSLFRAVYSYVDYTLVQSYGRAASSYETTWKTFQNYITPATYMIGFSFNEGDNTWHDTDAPLSSSHAKAMATFQPSSGYKAGIFSYAIDRDGNNPPGSLSTVLAHTTGYASLSRR